MRVEFEKIRRDPDFKRENEKVLIVTEDQNELYLGVRNLLDHSKDGLEVLIHRNGDMTEITALVPSGVGRKLKKILEAPL